MTTAGAAPGKSCSAAACHVLRGRVPDPLILAHLRHISSYADARSSPVLNVCHIVCVWIDSCTGSHAQCVCTRKNRDICILNSTYILAAVLPELDAQTTGPQFRQHALRQIVDVITGALDRYRQLHGVNPASRSAGSRPATEFCTHVDAATAERMCSSLLGALGTLPSAATPTLGCIPGLAPPAAGLAEALKAVIASGAPLSNNGPVLALQRRLTSM